MVFLVLFVLSKVQKAKHSWCKHRKTKVREGMTTILLCSCTKYCYNLSYIVFSVYHCMTSLRTCVSSIRAVLLCLFHACFTITGYEFFVFHHHTGHRENWVQELVKCDSFILPTLLLCLSNGAYLTWRRAVWAQMQDAHFQHYIYSLCFSPGRKFVECNVWDSIRNFLPFFFFFDSESIVELRTNQEIAYKNVFHS